MSEPKKINIEEIENPGLVWAMEQLRIQRNKSAEQQLREELLKATFIVPAIIKPMEEPSEPDENGQRKIKAEVRLHMVTNKADGSKVIPLFTDAAQKAKGEVEGQEKPTYMPIRLADVARVVFSDPAIDGVVVNPYGTSVRLTRAQLQGFFSEKMNPQELLKTKFIAPALVKPIGEPTEPDENGQRKVKAEVHLRTITRKSDEMKVLPIFTDPAQKEKGEVEGEEKPTYVPLMLADASRFVFADPDIGGVVINPYTTNIFLSRAQLQSMFAQKPEGLQTVSDGAQPKQQELRIGHPSKLPEGLADRLSAALRDQISVNCAWLRFMERSANERGFLCVVDTELEDPRPIFDALAKAAAPMPQGLRFFAASYRTDFGKKAVNDEKPFYERDVQVM